MHLTRLALAALAAAAISTVAHAQAPPSPAALCRVGVAQRFDALRLKWHLNPQPEGGWFCQDTRHEFTGQGETLMLTYEVVGDATAARKIWITSDLFFNSPPHDLMETNVVPLLRAVFAASGRGDPPESLVEAIVALRPVHLDTPFGEVGAAFFPGDDPAMPYNSARYDLEIDLH